MLFGRRRLSRGFMLFGRRRLSRDFMLFGRRRLSRDFILFHRRTVFSALLSWFMHKLILMYFNLKEVCNFCDHGCLVIAPDRWVKCE